MTGRERVLETLNHKEPDRVPLDLGASVLTGMHVSSVYKLRQALQLDDPGTAVKVLDPYQMLGEVGMDLVDALEVDVVQVPAATTLFGYKREGWEPWKLFDGTPVLVPEGDPGYRGVVHQHSNQAGLRVQGFRKAVRNCPGQSRATASGLG